MLRRSCCALVAVMVASLSFVGHASAHHAVFGQLKTEVLTAYWHHLNPGESVPPVLNCSHGGGCAQVTVSGTDWADVTIAGKDGGALLHLQDGSWAWYRAWSDNSGPDPCHVGLPGDVSVDLFGCTPPHPPRVPVGYGRLAEYKPANFTVTGDGSGFFGGRTGAKIVRKVSRNYKQLGKLKWTEYSSKTAEATGVEWAKFGPGDTASEAFHIDADVTLFFFDPVAGKFHQMTVVMVFLKDNPYVHGRHVYKFEADSHNEWEETSRYQG